MFLRTQALSAEGVENVCNVAPLVRKTVYLFTILVYLFSSAVALFAMSSIGDGLMHSRPGLNSGLLHVCPTQIRAFLIMVKKKGRGLIWGGFQWPITSSGTVEIGAKRGTEL